MEETIKKAIAADSYLKKRKNPSEFELQLFLKETSFVCPLCGKELLHRKQRKTNKNYEIAHIYPNSPTEEQYVTLNGLPRLGDNSEAFENKIALCKDCHGQQDYHTTKDDYLFLLKKKEYFLKRTDLREATITLGLEKEIADVISRIVSLREEEIATLSYQPVNIAKKFSSNDILLKNKVAMNITTYYPYIRDLFIEIEGKNGFRLNTLSLQIKCCFTKMDGITKDKNIIFNQIVDWIMAKTLSTSRDACETVVSFFIQNCEVFYEITE